MSGIAALYHLDGRPADPSAVGAMVRCMAHRGPDGSGTWADGPVALGHCMLRTTPEALGESQPVEAPMGRAVLTSDLRLDNRGDLLTTLGLRSPQHDPLPDSSVVLAAWDRWGDACLDHLVGPFAFALWDAPRGILFCARDHLGVVPLYYWNQPGRGFACASEIKGLLVLDDVPEVIDDVALARYLTRRLLDREETVFEGIRRLPPGHAMRVGPDGVRIWEYYAPTPDPEVLERGAGWSDEEHTLRFRARFEEAVRCRLRSVGTVGSELSGGLDSTYVTCTARDLLMGEGRGPLHTISLRHPSTPECDEGRFIESVVPGPGLERHSAAADAQGFVALHREIHRYLDDGRAGGNHHLNWLTARTAQQSGVRVLLTGQDGDTTVFHGWQRFIDLARDGDWATFAGEAQLVVDVLGKEVDDYALQESFRDPRDVLNAYGGTVLRSWAREGRILRLARAAGEIERHFGVPRRSLIRRFLRDIVTPRALLERKQRARLRRQAKGDVPKIIAQPLAERAGLAEALFRESIQPLPPSGLRELHRAAFSRPELDLSLEKVSLHAAAHGIEVRHPFMDRRLVEHCLALPPNQSLRGGWSRAVMRSAMVGVVPDLVVRRAGKTSLAAAYRFLLLHGDLEEVTALVSRLEYHGAHLDASFLRELFGRRDELDQTDVNALGMALGVAAWLESREGRPSPCP